MGRAVFIKNGGSNLKVKKEKLNQEQKNGKTRRKKKGKTSTDEPDTFLSRP